MVGQIQGDMKLEQVVIQCNAVSVSLRGDADPHFRPFEPEVSSALKIQLDIFSSHKITSKIQP